METEVYLAQAGESVRGFSVKYLWSQRVVELRGTIFSHRSKDGLWVSTSLGPHCIGQDFFLTEEEAINYYMAWFEEKRGRFFERHKEAKEQGKKVLLAYPPPLRITYLEE